MAKRTAQEPRITYSPITGQWFLLTKYRKQTGIDATTGAKKKYLRALEKHDITDQMVTIIREVERRSLAKRKDAGPSLRKYGRRTCPLA